ncbi:MAG: DoxX family protein [Cardiobacteriaceae bacterium]|nr:DoxX family protein [Cardiobacteriaceae bacterium]
MTFLSRWQPQLLSILRIVTAYMFILHGTAKVFGMPVDMSAGFEWLSLKGAAAILEIVGGTLLLLGLGTRPVAFLLSGHMAVAYFMVHASWFPLAKGGEAAALFSFIFIYIAAAGGGAWALDNAIGRDN